MLQNLKYPPFEQAEIEHLMSKADIGRAAAIVELTERARDDGAKLIADDRLISIPAAYVEYDQIGWSRSLGATTKSQQGTST